MNSARAWRSYFLRNNGNDVVSKSSSREHLVSGGAVVFALEPHARNSAIAISARRIGNRVEVDGARSRHISGHRWGEDFLDPRLAPKTRGANLGHLPRSHRCCRSPDDYDQPVARIMANYGLIVSATVVCGGIENQPV